MSIFDTYDKTQDSLNSMGEFFTTVKEKGIWYATTGETFKETLIYNFHLLVHYSDYLVIPALILVILKLAGSQRAGKWLYWSVITYLILKFLGAII